ncbi:MFS general substrate transporter [Colletotrichum zoysiae]|uniref:MFS general substrate transporter n=1 Tax=Colletotrichum zoysiae TaxID=1216348 RepID=A0AAD9H192_9PEZI|nr:MFS general substrate transporter [Colletotrichum zoysiae]
MASPSNVTTPISDRSFSVYSIASKPPPLTTEAGDKTETSKGYVISLLCLLNFIGTFDGTVLSTAITAVAQEIPGTTLEAFWTNTSMSLSSTVSQPLWIRLAEEFDKANVTLCALALFTMGSSLALLADSFGLLIAARTTQGLGIGGLMALTNMIVLDRVTSRESGALLGWINSVRALGSACGPIVGAALSQHAAWRWIFWANIPFAMIAFVTVPSLLRLETSRASSGVSVGDVVRRIDWLGMLLFVPSLTGLLIPITWGRLLHPPSVF